MSQSTTINRSITPAKLNTQHLPGIYLKTTNSPQKGQVKQTEPQIFSFLESKVHNAGARKFKDRELEQSYTIRKYLSAAIQPNRTQSLVNQTEVKDETLESTVSYSRLTKLEKIKDTLNIISIMFKYLELLEGCKKNTSEEEKNITQIDVKNECILELEQEHEEQQVESFKQKEDLLLISPIKQKKSSPQKKHVKNKFLSKIVLQINQQNKEYKKYASQMIRMIRQAQQSILKDLDVKRQQEERSYKLKKLERQKERAEALQNAQEGLKKRQLRSMILGLKGTEQQKSPLLLNLNKHSQSTICSRKTSLSKLCIQPLIEKQFDDKNLIRKTSMKSEMCSLETSWDLPISIQKII